MLVDAPFAPILREWQWSSPSATTALFWLLALVAVALLAHAPLPEPPHVLRARRPRRDVRRRRPGGPRRDLVRARGRRDPSGRARRRPHEGGRRRAARQPHHLARRARRPRRRDARVPRPPRVVVRLGVAGAAGRRPCARRRATRTSGSGRPTAPPTGSSGGSPTSAAASPTTSASSSTTGQRSTASSATGARKALEAVVDGYGVVVVDDAPTSTRSVREPGARVVHRDDDIAIVARSST